MIYNVLSIAPFDKQLKRLSKKYSSLKKEFASLIKSLEKDLNKAHLSEKIVSKSALPFLQKAKEKALAQGLSQIL